MREITMSDFSDLKDFEYDFGLSFAGEQRKYVEEVARELNSFGIRVFYDDYEKAELWGKDLYSHLAEIYEHLCHYCILFASQAYADKVWTSHERRSAQARALKEKQEYILPARFDDTPIPGLPETVHYIDLRHMPPAELAKLAATKLGNPVRQNYLPPILDRLFERLGISDDDETKESARSQAWDFFQVLRRMNSEERDVVLTLISHGCPVELPDNIHINTDLLRRLTGKSVARLKSILGGIRSLGFECSVTEYTEKEHRVHGLHGELLGDSWMFELNWIDLSNVSDYPELLVAREMVIGATENYCEEHGREFLKRLDFSQLASATASEDQHGKG